MDSLKLFQQHLEGLPDKLSRNTVKNYLSDVRAFIGWFVQRHGSPFDPRLIASSTVEEFKKYLAAQETTPATKERSLSSIRKFFQFLATERFITSELAERLKPQELLLASDPYHIQEFKRWLARVGLETATLKNYAFDVNHFISWLDTVSYDFNISESIKLANINRAAIGEYQRRLQSMLLLSPASLHRKLSSLRKYCQFATEKGYLATNPFATAQASRTKQAFYQPYKGIPRKWWGGPLFGALILGISTLSTFSALAIFTNLFPHRQAGPEKIATPKEENPPAQKAFAFAGRLLDQARNPISKTTTVVFSFYDDPIDSRGLLYQKTQTITPSNLGFFQVTLPDVPTSILTSQTPVYLGISVEGEDLRPRQIIGTNAATLGATTAAISPTLESLDRLMLTSPLLVLKTETDSDGSITLWPDGGGKINLIGKVTNALTGIVAIADTLSVEASKNQDPFTVAVDGTSVFTIGSQGQLKSKGGSFQGNLMPEDANLYDLGSQLLPWKTLHAQNVIPAGDGTQGYWQRSAGSLWPVSPTDDLLIGGLAITSATFRVNAQNGNITSNGDLMLVGGDIASTDNLTLTPRDGKNLNIVLSTTGAFAVNNNNLYVKGTQGFVGIGTSSPGASLAVSNNAVIGFGANSVEGPGNGLAVSGNVGIGTTNPTSKLEIVGGNCADDIGSGGCTADYAEFYPASEDVDKGDVVAIDSQSPTYSVKKTTAPYQATLMGIVSTAPASIADNGNLIFANTAYELDPRKPAVALSGRAPVKVSTENGPIEPGDFLTSSTIPGVAMKATRAGPVVGKALETFSCSSLDVSLLSNDQGLTTNSCQGRILVFMNVSWYDPQTLLASAQYDLIKETAYPTSPDSASQGEALRGNTIVSPLAQVDQVKTNILSPLASDTIIVDGRLAVRSLDVDTDATVSGTLHAGKIIADQIEGLEAKIASLAASLLGNQVNESKENQQQSTNAIKEQQTNISLSESHNLPFSANTTANSTAADVSTAPHSSTDQLTLSSPTVNTGTINVAKNTAEILTQTEEIALDFDRVNRNILSSYKDYFLGSTPTLSASDSATLNIDRLFASAGSFLEGLLVLGPSGFSDVSISGILSLGSQFILSDHSINVLGDDLKLQSLSQGGVSMAGGKVYIDSIGNLTVQGDVRVAGSIEVEKLSLPELIEKVGADGQTIKTQGTVGKGSISKGQVEVTIETPYVTQDSLIYITPTSDAGGFIPYLARLLPGKSFTVAISHWFKDDLTFNWWIIN